jgi:hypothetical protein
MEEYDLVGCDTSNQAEVCFVSVENNASIFWIKE